MSTASTTTDADATVSTDQALFDLVERYERKWPEIIYARGGSRARKAMQYVQEGRLHAIGSDQAGHDLWVVNGNRCSKAGKWCECEDRIRTDITYGKLCAHRLALALRAHWDGARNDALVDALASLTAHGAQHLEMLIERIYGARTDERMTLVGWIDERRQRQTWPHRLHVVFTLPQFQEALRIFGGWGIAEMPQNLGGASYYYRYSIAATGALPPTPEIFYARQRTVASLDRQHSRRLQLTEIAAHLPEILSGPITFTLGEWEARRVTELRAEMAQRQASAAEVWSRLPEQLRQSILESQPELETA